MADRRNGCYVFKPALAPDGMAQLTATHPYLDPTNADRNKPSDMLLVFSPDDERARAEHAGGEYVLPVEQLRDLQEWCASAPLSLRCRG